MAERGVFVHVHRQDLQNVRQMETGALEVAEEVVLKAHNDPAVALFDLMDVLGDLQGDVLQALGIVLLLQGLVQQEGVFHHVLDLVHVLLHEVDLAVEGGGHQHQLFVVLLMLRLFQQGFVQVRGDAHQQNDEAPDQGQDD